MIIRWLIPYFTASWDRMKCQRFAKLHIGLFNKQISLYPSLIILSCTYSNYDYHAATLILFIPLQACYWKTAFSTFSKSMMFRHDYIVFFILSRLSTNNSIHPSVFIPNRTLPIRLNAKRPPYRKYKLPRSNQNHFTYRLKYSFIISFITINNPLITKKKKKTKIKHFGHASE